MGSHSVTCHLTQVNTSRLNPSQIGWYSISLPMWDGRLSWPKWLVTHWDGLPAYRPIRVLTRQHTAGSWICNLLITSPTPYWPNHYTTKSFVSTPGGDTKAFAVNTGVLSSVHTGDIVVAEFEIVAEFGDSRRFRRQSPNSATIVALQCGQGF